MHMIHVTRWVEYRMSPIERKKISEPGLIHRKKLIDDKDSSEI